MFVIGIVLFSGSLYVMVFGVLCWFGVIMLLGGFGFVVGWVVLVIVLGWFVDEV